MSASDQESGWKGYVFKYGPLLIPSGDHEHCHDCERLLGNYPDEGHDWGYCFWQDLTSFCGKEWLEGFAKTTSEEDTRAIVLSLVCFCEECFLPQVEQFDWKMAPSPDSPVPVYPVEGLPRDSG